MKLAMHILGILGWSALFLMFGNMIRMSIIPRKCENSELSELKEYLTIGWFQNSSQNVRNSHIF